MLDLDDDWVWDFWVVHDGSSFHCFFLKAPRSLGAPELRHLHASVGHAVSPDLRSWSRVADALEPQPEPAFDDLATWTGSVVRSDDGTWHMFTTGLSRDEGGAVQRIGVSTSEDLMAWTRDPRPLLEADPRWYAVRGNGVPETHWRDPWVLRDDEGRWHLLATAMTRDGGTASVAHATSPDLVSWSVGPPFAESRGRFRWAEVVSVQRVERRWVMLFSCLGAEMPADRGEAGGTWSLAVPSPSSWGEGGCIDLDGAVRLTDERLYVGKVVQLPGGDWRFLAFRNQDAEGTFAGGLIDPMAVAWRPDHAGLRLVGVREEETRPQLDSV